MKRFIVAAILTVVILGTLGYFLPQSFDKVATKYMPQDSSVSLYCRDTSLDYVDMGIGKKVTCRLSDYGKTVACCSQIDGVSVSFAQSRSYVDEIIKKLNVTVVSYQQCNDVIVICGVSKFIDNGIMLDGQYVNIQIAYSCGTVTVGSPLILGDY